MGCKVCRLRGIECEGCKYKDAPSNDFDYVDAPKDSFCYERDCPVGKELVMVVRGRVVGRVN